MYRTWGVYLTTIFQLWCLPESYFYQKIRWPKWIFRRLKNVWNECLKSGFQTAANDGYFLVTKRRRSAVWNSDVYGWLHMYVVYAYNSRQWILYPHHQIGIYIFLEIPSKLSKPWYFIYGFKEGIVCMKIILWEINSNDILTSNIFINRITISR